MAQRTSITLALVLALSALGASACNPALPQPPLVTPEGPPIVVPFPPPPARADVVLDAPADMKHPVWIDGQWLWRGKRWIWQPGEWVDLEPDQVYALPYVVRRADGVLVWFQGTLRPPSSRPRGAPEDSKKP